MAGERIDHAIERVVRLAESRALGSDVPVVKAVVTHAERLEELERRGRLLERPFHAGVVPLPGTLEAARAKYVGPVPNEGMPVTHRQPELILHALAAHDAIFVVVAVAERLGLRPDIADGLDAKEGSRGHAGYLILIAPRSAVGRPEARERSAEAGLGWSFFLTGKSIYQNGRGSARAARPRA